MKLRISLIASVAVAMVLALLGVLNDASGHIIPTYPIQPFASDALGGISNNNLGQAITGNWTVTQTNQGERSALPWIFSGPGFSVDPDDGNYTKVLGTVWTTIDALCDGSVDYMAGTAAMPDSCKYPIGGPYTPWLDPLKWIQATTTVGPAEAYLTKIMPPWPWIARHEVKIDHLCLGVTGNAANTLSVLNTVYAQVPFSSGGINDGCVASGAAETACKDAVDNDADTLINDGCPQVGLTADTVGLGTPCANDIDDDSDTTFVAQTKLGGSPDTPPSSVCLDTPQSSTSVTTLYNNPPLANATAGGPAGEGGVALDNNSGLYARWTILQSQGSSSLARVGDLRKSYTGSPSIPSDIGYVERIIDLQCFWIDDDGCAACDANTDTIISETESWNDPDFTAAGIGGIDVADTDRDCLIQADKAQPGQPQDSDDEPNPDPKCPVLQYSENPKVVQYNTSADSDCDGLVDGIEVAYGTNPNNVDTDGDDAPDFVEMFLFTDPTVQDTDGDGYLDKPAGVYLNDGTGLDMAGVAIPADTDVDNCPTVKNGVSEDNQLNTDGAYRPNGIKLDGLWASNPNQDKLGDACDDDDDNDGATDAYENSVIGGKATSLPLVADTDGDRVIDGVEWRVAGGDPNDALVWPAWSVGEQVYFRGCHINVPAQGSFPPAKLWDDEYDTLVAPKVDDDVENDPDGDGLLCGAGDPDSDNGAGAGAAKLEIEDSLEAFCYGTGLTNKDTDGDGCEDWIEIADTNHNRTVNVADVLEFARRGFNIYPPSDSDKIFDINCNGFLNVADVLLAAQNSAMLKVHATCAAD